MISSRLNKYIEIFNSFSTHDKGRPFDFSTYNKLDADVAKANSIETNYFENNPPFEKNANELTKEKFYKLPLSPSEQDIIDIQAEMDKISKDLEDTTLKNYSPEEQKMIKQGYVFNAFNRLLNDLTDEQKNDFNVLKRMAMLRIIANDFVNNKKPENSIRRIKDQEKKVDDQFESFVASIMLGNFDENDPRLKKVEDGGYSKDRIKLYANIAKERMNKIFEPIETGDIGLIRRNLADAWARNSLKTEKELKNDPFTDAHVDKIKNNEKNEEFSKLAEFAKDVLSIQKNYKKEWYESKSEGKRKSEIIQNINNKLNDLIKEYPNKNRQEIVKEMNKFLDDEVKKLNKTSRLASHIQKVNTTLGARLNIENEIKKADQPWLEEINLVKVKNDIEAREQIKYLYERILNDSTFKTLKEPQKRPIIEEYHKKLETAVNKFDCSEKDKLSMKNANAFYAMESEKLANQRLNEKILFDPNFKKVYERLNELVQHYYEKNNITLVNKLCNLLGKITKDPNYLDNPKDRKTFNKELNNIQLNYISKMLHSSKLKTETKEIESAVKAMPKIK